LSNTGHCDFGVFLSEGFSKISLEVLPVTEKNISLS